MHIVIVGAGIIGLATAFELRARGAEITLVDPAPGLGASHAAAGMLAPTAETTWGQGALHRLMATSAKEYPAFIDRVEQSTGNRPAYVENSTLVVAAETADMDALLALMKLQASLGFSAERLLGSAARKLEPALATGIAGAIRCAEDQQLDPRSLLRILIDELDRSIVRETAVRLLRQGSRTSGVLTSTGQEIHGDQVLLANGLGALAGAPALPLRPVYGDILRLQGPVGAPLIKHTVRGIVHRQPVYLVPRTDGSLVLGASSREDGQEQVNVGEMHALLDNARRLVPGIVDTTLNEAIVRARPATPDDRPLLGRVDEGLVVSTGYSRHGVLLTPLGARLGTELLLGNPADAQQLTSVSLDRFGAQLANSTPF
ncbi:glycine oxidase ThiO [Arthrobacter sp. MYb224]|uniref:glycine oxidase ThiO n=1 Tax=Arthrobacter sp. MYb224 TaxID=1848600 RepID=UPI000CFC7340|nr:glycine oxidase ThiO [Arthrobacter sp. MYb224]PQZ99286.1 glycine oxidase ThiO [Arthrobacter sp. MYb224]